MLGVNTVAIGAQSGHARTTSSWVLGRLLRYFNEHVDEEMKDEQAHVPPDGPLRKEEKSSVRGKGCEALRVVMYEVGPAAPVPALD